ncbi:primosomal protein N' (replication factor Y) - superfamily II helicase [Sulfitobacter sp. F26169L]|uniref:primosomal protein N' (replication factor Y) - superfamily II helicase n=1 Tax=Sulfitobacter sp. F26169L TaxID=2996015 RepID=UPI00226089E4|nr:primosomal protein N' (replication factor Y) - superfamily II helicase [Sulfitobacter sp. F26169L]MCX7564772.1 primosomal protein N' (replication factor Y) - superfamily II helicase [Sulfitobacter sp. F26169L]
MPDFQPKPVLQEHRFPCDTCGSDLRYDPQKALLKCDHCGNEEAIGTVWSNSRAIAELDLRRGLSQTLESVQMEETRVSKCPNCAAQIEFDADSQATECPFCATPVVVDTGVNRHIKPRGVLPFALAEETARNAMKDWLGSLWFAPNGLQSYARKGRRMDGIYVPYWTYDAQSDTRYTGERGTVYYETQTVVRDGKRQQVQVAKVRWRSTSGRVARFFDDVLVLGSRSLPKRFTDALEPWDLTALEPYAPEYLAGFSAEAYTVTLDEGFDEARAKMDAMIRRDIKFDIGGDRQRIHSMDVNLSDMTFKHILLPVWLAAYKYRGKSYRFVVNGRTGRVQGERPYSAIKITFAVIAGLIAAAIIGYLYAQNG